MSRKLLDLNQIKYLLSGGTSFVIEYAVFMAVVFLSGSAIVANSISFLCGLIISFLLHRSWSFKGEHTISPKRQILGYIILASVNLAITNTVITLLVDIFFIPSFLAKLLSMVFIVVWNYFILNRVLFKRR